VHRWPTVGEGHRGPDSTWPERCSPRTLFVMTPDHKVLFGLGLEAGVHQVARCSRTRGLQTRRVSTSSASATIPTRGAPRRLRSTGVRSGRNEQHHRSGDHDQPAEPSCSILARTVTGCRRSPGVASFSEWVRRDVGGNRRPRRPPPVARSRIRALEEAIVVVRALSAAAIRSPSTASSTTSRADTSGRTNATIWIGSLGPKALAVTGRHADGWIPGHLATAQHAGCRVTAHRRPSGCFSREKPYSSRHHLQRVRAPYPGSATRDPRRRGPLDRGRSDAVGSGTDFRRA